MIVAAACHVHTVQHRAENPAAGPLQLAFGFLHQTIAKRTALDYQDRSVAALCDDRTVNDTSERRRIDDDRVVLISPTRSAY